MLCSLKINRLLQGVRGRAALDRQALIDAIVRLSRLAYELRDSIAEIDVNPMLISATHAVAVDALILRKSADERC